MNDTLQRVADRAEILDCMSRYARGVDRGDWDLVRTAYHEDAYDSHGDYKGGIDGFIAWLDERFAGVNNSMHFMGQSYFEFAGPDHAFVETYFGSRRLRAPSEAERATLKASDMVMREGWGRYADHFERRNGQWKVAHRIVIIEQAYTSVAHGGARSNPDVTWGWRDDKDPSHAQRQAVLKAAKGG